jgi:hypothetical protein
MLQVFTVMFSVQAYFIFVVIPARSARSARYLLANYFNDL